MKKQLLFIVATLVALIFSSCKDNGGDDNPNGPWGVELTAQYTKVLTGNSYPNDIRHNEFSAEIAGTGTVTIDWGDGTIIKDMPIKLTQHTESNGYVYYTGEDFVHIYDKVGTYSVKITGKDGAITFLNFDQIDGGYNQYSTIQLNRCTQLKGLSIEGNRLTSLDISKCTQLEELDCYGNQLTSLDISKCTQLEELECEGNRLTSLDVSKNTQLKELYCDYNQLTSLDISKNTQLKRLYCADNQLTSLDISKCTQLKQLYCEDNQLTSLDVSKNTQLKELYCADNQLSATAMNKIYNDLPSWPDNERGYLEVDEATAGNYSIAENKGWNVRLSSH